MFCVLAIEDEFNFAGLDIICDCVVEFEPGCGLLSGCCKRLMLFETFGDEHT